VSIFLTIAALLFVSMLPGQDAGDTNQKILDTITRMNRIEDGMARFMAANGRLPCPAAAEAGVNDVNFGWEAGSIVANSPPGSCVGGTPAASMGPDAGTNLVVSGMVPTKSLALPDDYALDAWGDRIQYTVDIRATTAATCYGLAAGGIQVLTKDPTGAVVFTDNVMHAYISHGPGRYGAWPAQGSTLAGRINTGIADTDKQTNAGVDASFVYSTTNFTNKVITKDRTAQFDDIVYYLNNYKNTCCVGQACTVANGFQSQGAAANDNTGSVVLSVDLNGDGLSDTAVCAPNANGGKGAVYVVFGSRNSFYGVPLPLPFSTLNGTNGVRIDGANVGDHICSSLAAGDVNGDDKQDLIIGAANVNGNKGAVYVIFGGKGTWPANFSVGGLVGSGGVRNGAGDTLGFVVNGENAGDLFGSSVASRDFNGDDFDDILVGAPGFNSNDGKAYLICGGGGPWPASFNVSALAGMPNPVTTCGIHITSPPGSGEHFGHSTAMGHTKGDYFADLIIGAPYATANGHTEAGHVYAIGGSAGPFTSPLDATALTGMPGGSAQTCGMRMDGLGDGHHTGWSVSAGDVHGDGHDDIAIGAPGADPGSRAGAGSTYVVYGAATQPATFNFNSVSVGSTGFRVDGKTAGENSGTSVEARCDVNGSGVRSLVIGSPNDSPLGRAGAGTVYTVYGATLSTTVFSVASLDGTSGFAAYGANAGEHAGTKVHSGDFFNFGLCTVIAGAPNTTISGNANAGSVYTVLGKPAQAATFDMQPLTLR
jgi:hypothetical protein